MTRFLVFFVIAYVVYYLLKNNLKGKTSEQPPQRRRDKQPDVVNAHIREIAYVYCSAKNDDNTCDVCKSFDGKHMLPNYKMLGSISPPHAGCKNPNGCRCHLVYVAKDEEYGSKVEALLKRLGGICDRQTVEKECIG